MTLRRLTVAPFHLNQQVQAVTPPPQPATRVQEQNAARNGRGLYATETIPAGYLILEEDAFIEIPRHQWDHDTQTQVNSLSDQQKTHIRMYCQRSGDPNAAWQDADYEEAIRLYSFATPSDRPGNNARYSLFPESGKLNHSCYPNACCRYIPLPPGFQGPNGNLVTTRLALRACTKIATGQEITINYIDDDEWPSRTDRHSTLAQLYSFTCRCSICIGTTKLSRASERRRKELQQYIDEVRPNLAGMIAMHRLEIVRGYVALVEKELGGLIPHPHRPLCMIADRRLVDA